MKKKSIYAKLCTFADSLHKVINFICVCLLSVQVVAILVMVFGRYIFRKVPLGTEEFALFCMVWFSILSISLSIRDDGHIKMEVMDLLVKKEKLIIFQIFSAIAIFIFSIFMIFDGSKLVMLTLGTKLSGFRISQGAIYFVLPVTGVCMCYLSFMFFLDKVMEKRKND